ncbi:MAG: hypothetical protein Q4P17_03940 [Methanobacterium sp.]|nr:hypothetical protein [Methanobacterium sp.]
MARYHKDKDDIFYRENNDGNVIYYDRYSHDDMIQYQADCSNVTVSDYIESFEHELEMCDKLYLVVE